MNAYANKNGVKLFALVAMLAMVFAGTAVVLSDDGVDAATGGTQDWGGETLTGSQTFNVSVNVFKNTTIDGGQLIIEGGDFTVAENVTLNIINGGSVIVNGGLVTINGTITINGNGIPNAGDNTTEEQPSKIIIGTPTTSTEPGAEPPELYKDYGVVVNGTISVIRGGAIETVKEESTYGEGSILVNNGATLNVSSSGSKTSAINGLDVDLAVGGTFTFNGKTDAAMTVQTYGSGDVKSIASATISGNNGDDKNLSRLTFTATSDRTTVYYNVSGGDEPKTVTLREYILNVSGTVNNNSTITFLAQIDVAVSTGLKAENYMFYSSEEAAERGAGSVFDDSTGLPKFAHNEGDFVYGKVIISELDIALGSSMVVGGTATAGDANPAFVQVTVSGTLDLSVKPENDATAAASASFTSYGYTVIDGAVTGDATAFANGYTETGVLVNGTLTLKNGEPADSKFVGAGYLDTETDTYYMFGDLQKAIDGAVAADAYEVFVNGGYKSGQAFLNGDANKGTHAALNDGYGAFIVDTDVTIPLDITLALDGGLLIPEGTVLTINGGTVEFANVTPEIVISTIWVKGKLVDYDTLTDDQVKKNIDFEVMSQVETETDIINTYTTFAIALAETTEGTIYLYDDVEIDRNMTIPENVTVQYASDTKGNLTFAAGKDYTLTINGEVFLDEGHNLKTTNGNVIVNNVIRYVDGSYIGESAGTKVVDGVYFVAALEEDDDTPYNYITSVAFAAANSASIDDEDGITIFGNIAMGDVTFTAGEDGLKVSFENAGSKDKATGNITISGNVEIVMDNGWFDGTLTANVTAGTVVIDIDGYDAHFTIGSIETTEGTETTMGMSSYNHAEGAFTIQSGVVTLTAASDFDKLVIASGAELIVAEDTNLTTTANRDYKWNTTSSNMPLFTEEFMNAVSGLIVEGTLTIEENASVNSYCAVIDGTVNNSAINGFNVAVIMVNGTVASADTANATYMLAFVNGTISGDVIADYLVAYPGSDVTGVEDMTYDGQDLVSTNYYVNGDALATVYAKEGVAIEAILLASDVIGVDYDTAKFYIDQTMTDMVSQIDEPNTTEDMLSALNGVISAIRQFNGNTSELMEAINKLTSENTKVVDITVGDYSNIYIGIDASYIKGTISSGTGLEMYIDDIKWDVNHPDYLNGLTVGTHTVSFDVKAGYDGANAVITFNGQTVENGGTIEITADMTTFTLVSSGAVPMDYTGGSTESGSSDGMGLTDYLLIILVVLIVIMAIMVAMRLMRS